MKWLITGGAGFIGTNAAKLLTAAGHECILADNFFRPGARLNRDHLAQDLKIPVHYLDIRFAEQVEAFWKAYLPFDVVLHLAGQVSFVASIENPRYDFDTNALGTFNVLEATRKHMPKARVIYSSTNKVYGDLTGLRYHEGDMRYSLPDYPAGLPEDLPIELHGGYSCSKGSADQYVRDYRHVYGVPTVSLRQSSIYGGNQYATEDQGWVAYFVQMGVQSSPYRISGTGKQVRDLLHISDLADLFVNVANLPEDSPAFGEAFNIGGGPGSSLSLVELFSFLRETYGFTMSYTAGPPRVGDQKVFIADTGKAKRLLGWQPRTSVSEGVAELVGWSRAQWSTRAGGE